MSETTELMTVKPPAVPFQITVTPTTVTELVKKFSSVKIAGIEIRDGKAIVVDASALMNDATGLESVVDARKIAVKKRRVCEDEHKKIKEDAKKECDRIDESRRELVGKIEVWENIFKSIEQSVEDEKEAIVQMHMDDRQEQRETILAEAGGIPNLLKTVMQANFVRVAEEQTFLEFLSKCRTMNSEAKELAELQEKNRLAEIERKKAQDAADEERRIADKIESDRLAAEQAAKVRHVGRSLSQGVVTNSNSQFPKLSKWIRSRT